MKHGNGDYELVTARRWLGVRMVALWACAERPAIPVRASAPQVSLTVIHVQVGAVLSVGGVILDPRAIIPAVPQRRAAITVRGTVVSEGNGGAVGVTDDKWAEQQHGTAEGRRR